VCVCVCVCVCVRVCAGVHVLRRRSTRIVGIDQASLVQWYILVHDRGAEFE